MVANPAVSPAIASVWLYIEKEALPIIWSPFRSVFSVADVAFELRGCWDSEPGWSWSRLW